MPMDERPPLHFGEQKASKIIRRQIRWYMESDHSAGCAPQYGVGGAEGVGEAVGVGEAEGLGERMILAKRTFRAKRAAPRRQQT
jgi:hypothetical protein